MVTYYTYYYRSRTNTPDSSGDWRYKFTVDTISQNYGANTSLVQFKHTIEFKNQPSGATSRPWIAGNSIDGGTWSASGHDDNHYSPPAGASSKLIYTQNREITHNSDGTKTINFRLRGGYWYSAMGIFYEYLTTSSKSLTLAPIPRYATITAFTSDSITATSFHFNVSANVAVDYVQHSLNGGAWTDSGNQTITGLSPGTQYSLRCRVRRTDSGLWTESGYIYITTLSPASITGFSWAKASGAAGLSTLTCGWSANASCDAVQYSLNGGGWTSSGTSGTSGSFNVGGLSPNVQYSLKIRVKRTDSQVWTESGTLYEKTYDYCKITGADSIGDESSPYMTFTNPSGAAIDAYIEYGFVNGSPTANLKRENISNTGNYTFTLTQAELNAIYAKMPNDPSQTIRYVITTKVGGTDTYWSWLDRTFTVVNANPTFNLAMIDYADQNSVSLALTGSNKKIIKEISNVLFTIQPMTANKGATPVKYQINSGSISNTVNHTGSAITALLNAVDAGSATVTAVDSRGKTTSVLLNYAQYVAYTPPTISALSIVRNGGVTENVIFNISGLFNNWTGLETTNNIQTIQYRYKVLGGPTWSSYATLTGTTYVGATYTLANVLTTDDLFDVSTRYDIEVKITDKITSYSQVTTLNSGEPLLWKDLENKLLGVGKKPDSTLPDWSLDLGGALQVNKTLRINSEEDASLSSTAHPLQIGSTTGTNIIFDNNEIMARNNGSESALYLNNEGGNVYVNGKIIKNNLIVDYLAPTETNNLVFNTLDLVGDGSIYDVEIIIKGSIAVTSLYLRANSFTQGYWYSVIRSWGSATVSGAINTQSYFWANSSYFQCGEISNDSFTQIIMTISKAPDGIKFVSSNNYVANGIQYMGTYSCNLYSTPDNLTSLSFWVNDGTIKAGSRIKIWRRDT